MSDEVTEKPDVELLIGELDQLRDKIAVLEQRIVQLDLLAHQDALINLPNRRGFMRALEQLIDRVSRYDVNAAMLFVDLDGLKTINDAFGHGAGDEALIQVARLLSQGVRRSDLVARIGGDEFGILLENANDKRARETALRLSELIGGSELIYEGEVLPLGVAIGVALIGGADSSESVIARADEEMYRRKAVA